MLKNEFMALAEPVAELVDKKHHDYNSQVSLEAYFPFGDKSYVHMLMTKVLRLVNLAHQNEAAIFESMDDSLDDLIAYAIFYRAYRVHAKKEKFKRDVERVAATRDVTEYKE